MTHYQTKVTSLCFISQCHPNYLLEIYLLNVLVSVGEQPIDILFITFTMVHILHTLHFCKVGIPYFTQDHADKQMK